MNPGSSLEDFLAESGIRFSPPEAPSVMIAILTAFERDGWLHPGILNFFSGAVGHRMRKTVVLIIKKRPTTAARNYAVAEFLKSDLDWLLMLDNDNVPPVDLFQMIDEANPQADILTPKIYANTTRSDFTLMWTPVTQTDSQGWRELSFAATACMMFRRRVFNKIKEPHFEFGTHPTAPILEDEQFCQKARSAGIRIFGNVRFVAHHFKTFDLADLARRYGEVDYSLPVPVEGKRK